MLPFLKRTITDPILRLLTQGISVQEIALSLAVGTVLGIFPSLGWTVLLCLVAASAFGLNLTAMQTANFAAYPLQLLLLIPFYRLGEILFRAGKSSWTLAQIVALIHTSIPQAIKVLWVVTIHAIAVWAVLAGPLIFFIYLLLKPILQSAADVANRRLGSASGRPATSGELAARPTSLAPKQVPGEW
ncbi:MAG TPA: DUF2062 domain-containing protein [Candidatus Acidoferrales bacterium]